jgi:hypothetical protein
MTSEIVSADQREFLLEKQVLTRLRSKLVYTTASLTSILFRVALE